MTSLTTAVNGAIAPSNREYFVGVEVGPAVIHACVFTPGLDPVGKAKISTKRERGATSVLERIATCVEYAVDECDLRIEDVRAVGVGAPGHVNPETGVVTAADSLGWRDVPLRTVLERLLLVPVFVENHFRLSALGAYAREVRTGTRRFAGLFLGPEIGGALMVDGEFASLGSPGNGSQFGQPLDSIFAVMPQAEFRRVRIRDLRKAARKGNPAVIEFVRAIAHQAGAIAADLHKQFHPELILLGGGLMDEMRDEILDIVQRAIQAVNPDHAPIRLELVGSVLGDLAGMTGGAVLAGRQLLQHPCGLGNIPRQHATAAGNLLDDGGSA